MATVAAKAAVAAQTTFRELQGIVLTTGTMSKTVKVRVAGQKTWNKFVKKFFDDTKDYLVHDPNNSLRTGDAVAIMPGWRTSKQKRHVVTKILAPAQVPINERPPLPSAEERWMDKISRKQVKDERRALRRSVAHAQSVVDKTDRLADVVGWELERMHKVLIQRDPEARLQAKAGAAMESAVDMLKKTSKLVRQAEKVIGKSAASRRDANGRPQ